MLSGRPSNVCVAAAFFGGPVRPVAGFHALQRLCCAIIERRQVNLKVLGVLLWYSFSSIEILQSSCVGIRCG
jgi:hypothetical protein